MKFRDRHWGAYGSLVFFFLWVAAMAWLVLYGPSSMFGPLLTKTVERDTPSSQAWEERFTIDRTIPAVYVHIELPRPDSELALDLAGLTTQNWMLRDFRVRGGSVRFSCGKDLPAGWYYLRVRERNVNGDYLVELGTAPGLTWHQRLLLVLSATLVLGIVMVILKMRRGRATPAELARGPWGAMVLAPAAVLVFLFGYLLLHEGGHALAGLCFGDFDWSRSDFFGFHGPPHTAYTSGVTLEPWQRAVQSLAGPLLPTIFGWGLFAFWRSKTGRRWREESIILDICLSISLMILAGQFGLVMPVIGFPPDGDYLGFVENVAWPRWQADGFLVCLAAINAAMLVRVMQNLVQIVKRLRARAGREEELAGDSPAGSGEQAASTNSRG